MQRRLAEFALKIAVLNVVLSIFMRKTNTVKK